MGRLVGCCLNLGSEVLSDFAVQAPLCSGAFAGEVCVDIWGLPRGKESSAALRDRAVDD